MPSPVERIAAANPQRAEEAIAESQPAVGDRDRVRGFAVDERQWKRLNASVPLVPPKPNEFDSAASIFISRAVPAT